MAPLGELKKKQLVFPESLLLCDFGWQHLFSANNSKAFFSEAEEALAPISCVSEDPTVPQRTENFKMFVIRGERIRKITRWTEHH